MKTWLIGILSFLLWSTGSTYWYVCKIKGNCAEQQPAASPSPTDSTPAFAGVQPSPKADSASADTTDAPHSPEPKGDKLMKRPPKTDLSVALQKPYTVLFAFAGPSPEQAGPLADHLGEVAAYLQANPSKKVLLRGYTDDTAARENNIKLAQRRCDIIAEQLHALGIAATQITTEPLGEADPVATNDTPAGRRLNRRVVISIQE